MTCGAKYVTVANINNLSQFREIYNYTHMCCKFAVIFNRHCILVQSTVTKSLSATTVLSMTNFGDRVKRLQHFGNYVKLRNAIS